MILFLHLVYILARYFVGYFTMSRKRNKVMFSKKNEDNEEKQYCHLSVSKINYAKLPVYEDDTLKFYPPAYIQRYECVSAVLQEFAAKTNLVKIADLGCSELGFFMYLKHMRGVTEILEVDIDVETLEKYSYKAAPLTSDYLMGKRKEPLDVYILSGSVEEYDQHLVGCDAVVCIELIEHLTEQCLENATFNIFKRIKPKLAVFTTPNADFNVLFPNFCDMRHNDHKFEWSRKEFYKWCQKVIKDNPEYSVMFSGIGAGPDGTENLGCCSQMAIFERVEESLFRSENEHKFQSTDSYRVIKHYEYPAYKDLRTTEEKIIHEVLYEAGKLHKLDQYYSYEDNESEIPIKVLLENVLELCSDEEEFLRILQNNEMRIKKRSDGWYLVYKEDDCSSSESDFNFDDFSEMEIPDNIVLTDEVWSDKEDSK